MVTAQIYSEPHFNFITPSKFIKTTPTLVVWGVASATALLLLGSDVPLVRKDVLSKIPLVKRYFPVEKTKNEED
ncbi:cytochrome b-c1 complex subunit 10 [Parasitella parasitica]|nr:cytochrome b-c1 complex subunit 10 [Parasitella parasitica]